MGQGDRGRARGHDADVRGTVRRARKRARLREPARFSSRALFLSPSLVRDVAARRVASCCWVAPVPRVRILDLGHSTRETRYNPSERIRDVHTCSTPRAARDVFKER